MKRIMSFVLTFVLLWALTAPVFAAEMIEESDIVAKYNITYEGEYRTDVVDGTAAAEKITVTGAPENAVTLVVIPMDDEALGWVNSCVNGSAVNAYDIHFLDAEGNRINTNGAKVSVSVSDSALTVSSVTTPGICTELFGEVSDGKLSFTTDGSHYYVICQKGGGEQPDDTLTVPVRGEENTVHADVTVEGDTVKLHELDFEEIDHVVGDHVETGVVEIDLTGLDENVTKVILPVTTVEHIVEAAEEVHNDTEALQIDFPHGSVKLDDKTMRAIVEQAECNEVILVLESVGETRLNDVQAAAVADWNIYGGYEAYLLCVSANKRISDFEGGVATLSVPFTVPAGYQESGFVVWYVADNGATEKLTSWFDRGRLHWDVGHFSDFIVVYEGEPPHAHSYSELVTKPTCTEKGYTTYTCSCGDSYVADYTEATGHSFTQYVSNKDATCKKDGTETAKCDHGCGATDTRIHKGSKLPHKYEDGKCVCCGANQWIPQTGDTAEVFLWAGILGLSLTGLFVLFFRVHKKKDEA